MECTTENLNILSNMKKKELIDLVFHFCINIAKEKNLTKDEEEKNRMKDEKVIVDLQNIFHKSLERHSKATIIDLMFRECTLTTITKYLLTKNKVIKKGMTFIVQHM